MGWAELVRILERVLTGGYDVVGQIDFGGIVIGFEGWTLFAIIDRIVIAFLCPGRILVALLPGGGWGVVSLPG